MENGTGAIIQTLTLDDTANWFWKYEKQKWFPYTSPVISRQDDDNTPEQQSKEKQRQEEEEEEDGQDQFNILIYVNYYILYFLFIFCIVI